MAYKKMLNTVVIMPMVSPATARNFAPLKALLNL